MATKINVRSPFYLNLTEPTAVTPLFTCETANILNLTIDQQGQISTPTLDYGNVISITSSDAGFSNDKFATVSTATDRNLTVRVAIPAGFSNSADGFIDCDKVISQPAVSCTAGPTTSGSIPAQTIDVDGDSETIDLTSYFTQGNEAIAGYNIYNPNPALVNTSLNGNDLTISSNAIGGSTNIQVSAFDNESGSCTATQSIAVTVNNPTVAFSCNDAGFTGGSIAQDGTLTKPDSVAVVGQARTISGDTGSNITNYTANNTGSDRSVTIFFDLTAPAGYSNAGSTVECSKDFTQPAAAPTFDCDTANLSGQQISTKGQISIGNVQIGTISSFSPLEFAPVSTDTARTVTFTITIPAGYSNSGTIDCDKVITQPAELPTCGANSFKISAPKVAPSDFCDNLYTISQSITSTSTTIPNALGKTVCLKNAPFDGKNFYYAVATNTTSAGKGTGKFYLWQIDSNGVVQDVQIGNCPTDGTDSGQGKFGAL